MENTVVKNHLVRLLQTGIEDIAGMGSSFIRGFTIEKRLQAGSE